MAQTLISRYLSSAALVALSACASAPALRPIPVLGSDVSSCSDLEVERPPVRTDAPQPDPARLSGWVAIAYSLKGDGKVSDMKIIDSEPKNEFVQGAVQGLRRSKFKPGAERDNCVAVLSIYRR